jgi:hypothetical protein
MASGKRIRDVSVSDEDTDREGSLFDDSPSETSKEGEQAVKRQQMDNSQTSQSLADRTIRCSLPPHADMDLPSYHAYEVHYEQYHLHRCSECLKNFPSDHYLQLHITENHDPITALKKERGERTVCLEAELCYILRDTDINLQFACFVEDCDRKCSTAQKRRMHIIDKHGFPKVRRYSACPQKLPPSVHV